MQILVRNAHCLALSKLWRSTHQNSSMTNPSLINQSTSINSAIRKKTNIICNWTSSICVSHRFKTHFICCLQWRLFSSDTCLSPQKYIGIHTSQSQDSVRQKKVCKKRIFAWNKHIYIFVILHDTSFDSEWTVPRNPGSDPSM